jgi:hypothetical protein
MVYRNCNRKVIYLITIFTLLTIFASCGYKTPVSIISYIENGQNYSIEAVTGQVIVIFSENAQITQAIRLIRDNNGIILKQEANKRYNLVYTGAGKETQFINQLKNNREIQYIFYNIISYPCKVTTGTHAIDNFYVRHGNDVSYVFKECGLEAEINVYNAGIKGDEKGRLSQSEINSNFISILNKAPKDMPVVINMSFGPGFIDDKIKLWTDERITDAIKNAYIYHYKESLKNLIGLASFYKDKDFVVVKAAGNEGLKQLDEKILNDLVKELSNADAKVLNDHFILVGAEDDRNSAYSNTVTSGNYNSLYTSVNIKDLKHDEKDLLGTSFASPRVACYISTAINENGIKATEALQALRDVTKNSQGLPITQTSLNTEVKKVVENSTRTTTTTTQAPTINESNNNVRQNSTETTQSNPRPSATTTSNIIGTRWECKDETATSWFSVNRITLEFRSDYVVEITNYFVMGSSEINYMYKYYREENGRWRMYQTSGVGHLLNMSEEEERNTAMRMGNYYMISVEGNKLYLLDVFGTQVREYNRY